jgi:hypothetical protein
MQEKAECRTSSKPLHVRSPETDRSRRGARRARRRRDGKGDRRVLEPRRVGRRDRGVGGRWREAHARAGSRHSRSAHARTAGPVPRVAGEPSRGGAPRVLRRHVAVQSSGCRSGLEIVREFDRYHGFAAAERRSHPDASEAPEEIAPWLGPTSPKRSRPQMAPQRLEKIESAPGNGMAPEAPDPQDMVQRCDGAASLAPPPAKLLARSRRLRPARKWQRKSSRRLNPRPEMVWLRKARAPKIWRRHANHSSAQPPQSRAAPDGWASG